MMPTAVCRPTYPSVALADVPTEVMCPAEGKWAVWAEVGPLASVCAHVHLKVLHHEEALATLLAFVGPQP